jgi:hypothetical protein
MPPAPRLGLHDPRFRPVPPGSYQMLPPQQPYMGQPFVMVQGQHDPRQDVQPAFVRQYAWRPADRPAPRPAPMPYGQGYPRPPAPPMPYSPYAGAAYPMMPGYPPAMPWAPPAAPVPPPAPMMPMLPNPYAPVPGATAYGGYPPPLWPAAPIWGPAYAPLYGGLPQPWFPAWPGGGAMPGWTPWPGARGDRFGFPGGLGFPMAGLF